jgi:hypothetical protein
VFDVASKEVRDHQDGATSDMGNINTYDSATDAEADRAQQKALLKALNAWDRALRRDECGAWTITGTRGSIHTLGDDRTWVLFVACRSGLHWTATKKRLGFCEVTQDCEDEGCLRLLCLPTPEQAVVIRDVLGVRKRQEISEAMRERLRAFAFSRARATGRDFEPKTGKRDRPGANPLPEQTPILAAEPAK